MIESEVLRWHNMSNEDRLDEVIGKHLELNPNQPRESIVPIQLEHTTDLIKKLESLGTTRTANQDIQLQTHRKFALFLKSLPIPDDKTGYRTYDGGGTSVRIRKFDQEEWNKESQEIEQGIKNGDFHGVQGALADGFLRNFEKYLLEACKQNNLDPLKTLFTNTLEVCNDTYEDFSAIQLREELERRTESIKPKLSSSKSLKSIKTVSVLNGFVNWMRTQTRSTPKQRKVKSIRWKGSDEQLLALFNTLTASESPMIETNLSDFRIAFSGDLLTQHLGIKWMVIAKSKHYSKSSLILLLKLLSNEKLIDFPTNKTIEQIFSNPDGEPAKNFKQSIYTESDKPARSEDITNAVNSLETP